MISMHERIVNRLPSGLPIVVSELAPPDRILIAGGQIVLTARTLEVLLRKIEARRIAREVVAAWAARLGLA